jgi:hypothetical protein
MPSLLVKHDGRWVGWPLKDRLLIGRTNVADIVVPETTVSRLHAWLGLDGVDAFLEDAGSRTGTRVNGNQVSGRHLLRDGDCISVGAAQLHYCAGALLPEGVPEVPPRTREEGPGEMLFDCVCGMPMLMQRSLAGRAARCRRCGETILIPSAGGGRAVRLGRIASTTPNAVQRPQAPATSATRPHQVESHAQRPPFPLHAGSTVHGSGTSVPPLAFSSSRQSVGEGKVCGICQCRIEAAEELTACTSCGLPFHRDCWSENFGCSTYGCNQVNVLKPGPDIRIAGLPPGMPPPPPLPPPLPPPPFTYEPLFVLATVFAALLGAVLYGIPCLIATGASVFYLIKGQRSRRRWMLIVAIVVGAIAFIVEAAVSSI